MNQKTLIINGSPRVQGDTVGLLSHLLPKINGEYKIVNAYESGISPCVDCRYCQTHKGCSIQDEMQEVYTYLEDCDTVIIASPIYFSELTGKLLDFASRLQTYFSARFFRKEIPILKPKKGAVLLVGGGDGNPMKAYETACTLLHHMNCYDIHPLVVSHSTNERPAIEDEKALQGIKDVEVFLYGNQLHEHAIASYHYRELNAADVERLHEIDATCYIKNAWRLVNGERSLIEINWTDHELPNGMTWHKEHFIHTIESGGKAFGCFDNDVLIGFATLDSNRFGIRSNYLLLDQLFISKAYRGKGLGKNLFYLCSRQARYWDVDKLYLFAGSSEDTLAFYQRVGCEDAKEINQVLLEEDPNDIQLEYNVRSGPK